ncbi:MAG TPA: hypothetical protein VFR44_00260 [Actinomycetota bacterium]|nr:hypothetical protein [Actinomycetota bacterium]
MRCPRAVRLRHEAVTNHLRERFGTRKVYLTLRILPEDVLRGEARLADGMSAGSSARQPER